MLPLAQGVCLWPKLPLTLCDGIMSDESSTPKAEQQGSEERDLELF